MSTRLKQILSSLLIIPIMALGVSAALQINNVNVVRATEMTLSGGVSSSQGDDVPQDLAGEVFKNVVNILLFIIGAVSVIMLIYGGIRYTTSGGNANSVTAAKNTIMYSIIGLVVAILAFAVVQFVVNQVMDS
ncbi:hypothetical protein KBE99_00080 [Candidatus Saccharibacteria bacterium]|nr:hypothetical protein [Candidatus Saccharibacteria bacterium]